MWFVIDSRMARALYSGMTAPTTPSTSTSESRVLCPTSPTTQLPTTTFSPNTHDSGSTLLACAGRSVGLKKISDIYMGKKKVHSHMPDCKPLMHQAGRWSLVVSPTCAASHGRPRAHEGGTRGHDRPMISTCARSGRLRRRLPQAGQRQALLLYQGQGPAGLCVLME